MNQTAIEDDGRYDNMFRVEKEADALGTGLVEDPHPAWAEILSRGPVHKGTLSECMGMPPERSGNLYKSGLTYYSVFGFAAVSDVFTRKDDFSSGFYLDVGIQKHFGDSILNMDGLRHRRYRDLIQEYFQPAAANSWWREKVILDLADELIDAFGKDGHAELSEQFFSRLPMQTVTIGFGMSREDGVEFRHHIQRGLEHGVDPAVMANHMKEATRILEKVIRTLQAEPQDDIISRLAHAELTEDDGTERRLTVDEIAAYCRLIVFAGGGTTWRQLGITTFALLNHRDQLETVIKDRSLLWNAILESARWNPTDPVFPRKAIHDTELHGVKIPKDSVMHLCLSAANRDPERWENPDEYNMFRPVQRSVAFAAGHHSCLGQHVARQEMTIALNTLFDRFPNIRWDPSQPEPKLTGGLIQRGPNALPVLLN